jgi:hypothetical protein
VQATARAAAGRAQPPPPQPAAKAADHAGALALAIKPGNIPRHAWGHHPPRDGGSHRLSGLFGRASCSSSLCAHACELLTSTCVRVLRVGALLQRPTFLAGYPGWTARSGPAAGDSGARRPRAEAENAHVLFASRSSGDTCEAPARRSHSPLAPRVSDHRRTRFPRRRTPARTRAHSQARVKNVQKQQQHVHNHRHTTHRPRAKHTLTLASGEPKEVSRQIRGFQTALPFGQGPIPWLAGAHTRQRAPRPHGRAVWPQDRSRPNIRCSWGPSGPAATPLTADDVRAPARRPHRSQRARHLGLSAARCNDGVPYVHHGCDRGERRSGGARARDPRVGFQGRSRARPAGLVSLAFARWRGPRRRSNATPRPRVDPALQNKQANAPAIVAATTGAAAAKLAYDRRDGLARGGRGAAPRPGGAAGAADGGRPAVARLLVRARDLPPVVSSPLVEDE